jgi:uncharacterized protein with FMN-binding domain
MIPKRGAIAGFLTAIGLALLLSFKTPDVSNLPANPGGNGNTALGGNGNGNGNAVATDNGGSGSGNGAGNGSGTGSGTGSGSGSGSGGGTAAQAGGFSGTVTGQAVQIPFGVVQVSVTFQNGKITNVQNVQLPQGDRHTNQISQYAGPQLRTQALQAQSANINGVSGATYTSYGYQQSLQSALDQAH